jgi:ADP-ribosylglycohydrolase
LQKVLYIYNKQSYNELKQKGFRLEFKKGNYIMNNLLLSAAIGDISGQPYEFDHRTKVYAEVDLLGFDNTYTDDTVCTFACAEALLHHLDMATNLRLRGRADWFRGFGGRFAKWLMAKEIQPSYHSYGNGSGMRVSAAGFMAKSVEECIDLATKTALPTHDHPEGIKGAVATALAIYYGMQGKDKDYIRHHVLDEYYPNWSRLTYAGIKPGYGFDETCQQTIPAALICFLESKDYVDCLKLAIALGGDADTLAAISGPMAYAFYKCMPEELIANAKAKLPEWMLQVNEEFDQYVNQ